MPRRIAMPRTDTTIVGLRGGLDLVSPPTLATPGTLRDGQNFEVIEDFTGGYRRIDGYDQFDGRGLPKDTDVTHVTIALEGTSVANDVTKNPALFSSLTNKGIALQDSATDTPSIYGEMVAAETCEGGMVRIQTGSNVPRMVGWVSLAVDSLTFGDSQTWKGISATHPDRGAVTGGWVYYNDGTGSLSVGMKRLLGGRWTSLPDGSTINGHVFLGAVTTLPAEGDSVTVSGNRSITVEVGHCVVHEGALKVLQVTQRGQSVAYTNYGEGTGTTICVSLINVAGDFVAYPDKEDADPTYIYLLDTVNPLAVGERIGVVAGLGELSGDSQRRADCNAANRIRAIRNGVPGSGPIRGVVQLGADVFAFRDNTAADAQKVYKATANGWAEVGLGYIFNFDAGSGVEIPEGTEIAHDAGRSRIRRIVTYSGSWAAGTAQGLMLMDTPSPAFPGTNEEVTVTHGTNRTTFMIHSNVRENTLNAGGKWQFIIDNFKGQHESERIYGVCAGTNHIIEFDGQYLVPIETALTYTNADGSRNNSATNDYPTNIAEYQNHLFYSRASSIFCSGIGDPHRWTVADGGAEFAMGHTVTGLSVQSGLDAGAAMAIFTSQRIIMLHGTSQPTFETSLVQANLGAIQNTVHQLERTYFMNNLGLFDLESAFRYSKFQQASHSYVVWPFLRGRLSNVVDSVVNRIKNQYRIFFSDGTALYGTFINGKIAGYMKQVFPHTFSVVWNGIDGDGNEVTYAGDSTTGDVYRLDTGNTFNGEPIDARISIHWDTGKMPRTLKTYRRATLHLEGHDYVEYTFGYKLAYDKSDELQQELPESISADVGSLSQWDSFQWDMGSWDGANVQPAEISIGGSGESISFEIASSSDCSSAFDVKSLSYDFTSRRKLRG